MSQNAKQSPRTLIVAIDKDLKVTLTRGQSQIAEASVNEPGEVASTLTQEFKSRKEQQLWSDAGLTRPDLPADERIERTVFVKAPQSFKYGEVVKVIDAIKGAGASPVGLQTEALEP